MSKLRIRRGDKVLGSTDEDGLADWLESGIISEFDLVAEGEDGEDWQLIRDFMATRGGVGSGHDAGVDEAETLVAGSADELDDEGDSGYRPIWDVDDEEDSDDEPAADIRVPNIEPDDEPEPPPRPKRRPAGRSSVDIPSSSSGERRSRTSGSHPAVEVGGTGLDDAEIDSLFRRLLKWESEAPKVRDPAGGKSDSGRPKKSAKRESTSGAERPRRKKRKKGPSSNPDQPRRQRRDR